MAQPNCIVVTLYYSSPRLKPKQKTLLQSKGMIVQNLQLLVLNIADRFLKC